ncbi:hypothetical protein Dimus_001655 [Dionaea muscipula]
MEQGDINFVGREGNESAHRLAKWAARVNRIGDIVPHLVPHELRLTNTTSNSPALWSLWGYTFMTKKKIKEVSHEWQLINKQKPIWLRKPEDDEPKKEKGELSGWLSVRK